MKKKPKFVAMWDMPGNDVENVDVVLLLRPFGDPDSIDAYDVETDTEKNRENALVELCSLHGIDPSDVIDERENSNSDLNEKHKTTSQELLMKILVYLEKTQSSVFVSMNDEGNDGNHEAAESLQKQHDALDNAINALQAFQKERGDL